MFQAALEASVKLLDEYERGQLPSNITDSELWAAQKTKQAIIHPDTGEKIFMPFRMSGYIPFGSPIVSHSLGTWLLVNVCDSVWLLLFDADFDLESWLSTHYLPQIKATWEVWVRTHLSLPFSFSMLWLHNESLYKPEERVSHLTLTVEVWSKSSSSMRGTDGAHKVGDDSTNDSRRPVHYHCGTQTGYHYLNVPC